MSCSGGNAPKKKRGLWTEKNLKLAVEAVQNKQLSQVTASEKYGIPRRTLRNHLKSGVTSKLIGKQTTLNKSQENELCQRIKRFAEIGLPLTPRFIRKQAFQFCETFDIPHRFNTEKQMAGPDWIRLFLKRNPSVSKRKPQIMNPARAQKMNKPIVEHHFQAVQGLYDELDILSHPERLYNMDEKGCRITVHHQNTVLAAKGSKRVHLIAPEHAENVTIAMCVNAIGTTIPPMIIFKGQRNNPELEENLPAGSLVRMAKKGSMTTDLFVEFIQHLGRYKVPGKCLLVFDGAKSHMSYEAVQEAEKHDIVLYCLPSNTTHELQPLDKSVNKSFEHHWDEEVLRVLYNKPDTRLTKATFNKMLSNIWPKCMTHTNIVNGFRATGLFPFNPDAIPEEAFAPSLLTEIPFRPEEDENIPMCENQLSKNSTSAPTTNATTTTSMSGLFNDKGSKTLSVSNEFSASLLRQSSTVPASSSCSHRSEHRLSLVDYSSSSTNVSDDETDKENCSPSTLLDHVGDTHKDPYDDPVPSGSSGLQDNVGRTITNPYDDPVPSCSGLQKHVLHTDTSDSDTSNRDSILASNYLVRKLSAKKICYARNLYSFSSDDDENNSTNKGDITPKKPIKLTTQNTYASNNYASSRSGASSISELEDDDVPLINLRKKNGSFHKLLPTPNYAITKSKKPRKKALNYKGVQVTKDLFKTNDTKQNKNNKNPKKTSSLSKQVQTKKTKNKDKESRKDKKEKNKVNMKANKKPRLEERSKQVTERKSSKELHQEDKWYCHACMEEKIEDMRECKSCSKWYHELCVGLTKHDLDFICSNCDYLISINKYSFV